MGHLPRIVIALLVWAAALFGVLQVGLASGHALHEHSICGPWGCGPPTSALVGWHGFWLLLGGPLVGIAIGSWSARRQRNLGLVLFSVGLLILAGIGVREAVTWLPKFSPDEPTYMIQRYLFSVITMTDVPTIPVALSGIALLISSRVKSRGRTRSAESKHESNSPANKERAPHAPLESTNC